MKVPPQSPRRLLLTGVAGLIGSRLSRELLSLGWHVVGVDDFSSGWRGRLPEHPAFEFHDLDITRPGALGPLLAELQEGPVPVEALVHLAARVGVRSVLQDPEGCRDSNLSGVRELANALEGLPLDQRPRLYAASTSEVYREARRPLEENDPTRSTDGEGRWAYAGSKLRGEQLLDEAFGHLPPEQKPMHLRFFNVVGPGQDANSGMVLARFVEQALSSEDLSVHGDGSQVRTFAHVDQVARTLAQIVGNGKCPGGALNVGGEALTTIGDLAREVIAVALTTSDSATTSQVLPTNPLVDVGANFEPIAYREPNLTRLASFGVQMPQMTLSEIVADTLQRHREFSRPSTRSPRSSLCVSPAS